MAFVVYETFILSNLVLCLDDTMGNITSSADMKRHGWKVHVDYSNTNIEPGMETWFSNYRDACGVDTFFGYRRNDKRGAVSYTFRGYGKATLNVGNCLSQGRVDIYLNNVRQTFLRGGQYTSFVFNYKKSSSNLSNPELVSDRAAKTSTYKLSFWFRQRFRETILDRVFHTLTEATIHMAPCR